jgi:hypothetical protein
MTNAKRFGLDKMNVCRADAGPLCSSKAPSDALKYRASDLELMLAYGEAQENYNP